MSATPKTKNNLLLRFVHCERGATAIEYALIASGIAIAIVATVLSLGTQVRDELFVEVSKAVK